jgi:hypothetical protein
MDKWIHKKNHLDLFKIELANFPADRLLSNRILLITQVEALKTFLKDQNLNVVNCALKAIQALVSKLGPSLQAKNLLFIAILERFKEKTKINKEILLKTNSTYGYTISTYSRLFVYFRARRKCVVLGFAQLLFCLRGINRMEVTESGAKQI